ncbi:glycosylated lysosomal membrane protein-like [Toxorhynchites rutilus septentrionalis]|uniref:glycosylated lysosomal membrane protein-like n=1 Tax=Toxorhynchites rutilus septentrionalis TaxID=329112 RepID=UPI002478A497|nr:glycosylated lysosomal membrane protein-like [Toxorhynchites rutilus septentrionalis]
MFTLVKFIVLFVASVRTGWCLRESNSLERKLTAYLNPGCPENICLGNSTDVTLIHIRADSAIDTIHYVWDFTGKPTILVALTSKNASLVIHWDDFFADKSESVQFTEQPKYTFMTIINRIFQFDDPEDKGTFANNSAVFVYDPYQFVWNRTLLWYNEKDVIAALNAGNDFLVKLNAYSTRDHGIEYPHLLHSSNATQIDIVFNNVSSKFERPRFAIELLFVVSEQAVTGTDFEITKRKNLDDEHTPGIFEIIDVLSPGAFKFSAGGYIEYRPVSYTQPERDVSTSTETHQSEPTAILSPSEKLNTTLAYAIYGQRLDTLLVQGMNISFGFSGDGFYSKTNYTTMTFQVGYGFPPIEELSAFVLIVAGIGIGVPLIMLVIGGLYVFIRKLRNRSATHV